MLQINDLQEISLNSQHPQWAIFSENFEIVTSGLVIVIAALLLFITTQVLAGLVWGTTTLFQRFQ